MKKDFVSYVEANAQKYADQIILHGKNTDGSWSDITWRELWDDVQHLAQSLIFHGVKEGDRVVIFSQNMTQWQVADLAIMSIRGITIPIYATSSHSQASYIINETESKIVFVGSQMQYDIVLDLSREGKIDIDSIVAFDPQTVLKSEHSLRFSDYISSAANDELYAEYLRRRQVASEDDLATIIYTSGTTGEPKGVMLGHDNVMQAMRIHDIRLTLTPEDVSLSFLPLCHVFERGWSWFCLYKSCPIYILTDTKVISDTLPEVAPTAFCSVPRVYEKMYQKVNATVLSGFRVKRIAFNMAMAVGHRYNENKRIGKKSPWWLRALYCISDRFVFKTVKKAIGGRLRIMPTAGAHVPNFVVDFFHSMGIRLMVGYGLTESTATVSAFQDVDYQIGSVGQPLTDVEVKIGEENEILVRSKTIMRGYYKKPEATAEVIDSEGWFHTGDAGMIDSKGNLYITERIKDLMKTSQGKYIAPQMIEARLTSDAMIEQVLVVGDSKPYVTALVVPNLEILTSYAASEGIEYSSPEELVASPKVIQMYKEKIDSLCAGLAGYEQIKKFTLLPNSFSMDTGELTPTLKIRRKVILEKMSHQVALMYAGSDHTSGAGEK